MPSHPSDDLFATLLTECRHRLGTPPRYFDFVERTTYLTIDRPSWCTEKEPLNAFFKAREALLRDGTIHWGHIIQANKLLFSPGPQNCPGEVVYSLKDSGATPSALSEVARKLYALKGTTPDAPELAVYANYLTNERIRTFGIPVPSLISPDLECLTSTIFFARQHLPVPYLADSFFPILVSPGETKLVMVVPSRFWPERMVRVWAGRQA